MNQALQRLKNPEESPVRKLQRWPGALMGGHLGELVAHGSGRLWELFYQGFMRMVKLFAYRSCSWKSSSYWEFNQGTFHKGGH